jgi:hypothetical protein
MVENQPGQRPAASEVISALSRTGFILEYRVAQILRRAEFQAEVNYAYPDPETEKSREIDVSASFEEHLEERSINISLSAELVIECKNNSSPLVVIGERGQDPVFSDDGIRLSFDPYDLKFPKGKSQSLLSKLGLHQLPQDIAVGDFVGHQLVRMSPQGRTWKADNNSIYDSILYPLAKAWQYQIWRFGP